MNVDDLSGKLLNYWVAMAEGFRIMPSGVGDALKYSRPSSPAGWYNFETYSPVHNWNIAGEIISRENIQLGPPTSRMHRNGGPQSGWGASGMWSACTWHQGVNGRRAIAHHPTCPRTAAMRCYVKSKFGDEVAETELVK